MKCGVYLTKITQPSAKYGQRNKALHSTKANILIWEGSASDLKSEFKDAMDIMASKKGLYRGQIINQMFSIMDIEVGTLPCGLH